MLLVCQSDKHGTKHREHISLHKSHQQLKRIHEEQHDGTKQMQSGTHSRSHGPTQENDTREGQYHSVSRHHIGKETDHQRKGLGEHSEQLYSRHDGNRSLQEYGHIGPEDILPVLSVAKQVDSQERTHSQEKRDVDVTRHVRATWEDRQQS